MQVITTLHMIIGETKNELQRLAKIASFTNSCLASSTAGHNAVIVDLGLTVKMQEGPHK